MYLHLWSGIACPVWTEDHMKSCPVICLSVTAFFHERFFNFFWNWAVSRQVIQQSDSKRQKASVHWGKFPCCCFFGIRIGCELGKKSRFTKKKKKKKNFKWKKKQTKGKNIIFKKKKKKKKKKFELTKKSSPQAKICWFLWINENVCVVHTVINNGF